MSILSQVNLNQALTPEEYEERLIRYQVALSQLAYQVYVQKRPVALVFEGWDAAGKGGAIKRLTERLDPRGYVVYPIAAPAGEDRTHHYLYRFWRRLPERGQIAVFDRSWYRPGDGGAHRGVLHRGRVEARLSRDQPVRAPARRFRRGHLQVLGAYQQG